MVQTNIKMTPEQFVYWLQGFVEIRETEKVGLTEKEWNIIQDHLKEVFCKVTPNYTYTEIRGNGGQVIVPYVGDDLQSHTFIC